MGRLTGRQQGTTANPWAFFTILAAASLFASLHRYSTAAFHRHIQISI